MRRDIESFCEFLDAMSVPKASIASSSRAIGISVASLQRWIRLSRETPDHNHFDWEGETAPLFAHLRRARQIANARFQEGERPEPRPLRHRMRHQEPVEVEDDPTADAPLASEPERRNVTPVERRGATPVERRDVTAAADADIAELANPVGPGSHVPETALTRDLRARVEARARGEVIAPLRPVIGAAPTRYVSAEERAEGIGKGIVRDGGFKVS